MRVNSDPLYTSANAAYHPRYLLLIIAWFISLLANLDSSVVITFYVLAINIYCNIAKNTIKCR